MMQVVCNSNDLEAEASPESFFAVYSLVNNSLEERFIDLLLLLDGQQTSSKLEERCSIDISRVVEALKVVSLDCKFFEMTFIPFWHGATSQAS